MSLPGSLLGSRPMLASKNKSKEPRPSRRRALCWTSRSWELLSRPRPVRSPYAWMWALRVLCVVRLPPVSERSGAEVRGVAQALEPGAQKNLGLGDWVREKGNHDIP